MIKTNASSSSAAATHNVNSTKAALMVDDTIAEGSEVKLEAKHKADGSWHPCQVSLW